MRLIFTETPFITSVSLKEKVLMLSDYESYKTCLRTISKSVQVLFIGGRKLHFILVLFQFSWVLAALFYAPFFMKKICVTSASHPSLISRSSQGFPSYDTIILPSDDNILVRFVFWFKKEYFYVFSGVRIWKSSYVQSFISVFENIL